MPHGIWAQRIAQRNYCHVTDSDRDLESKILIITVDFTQNRWFLKDFKSISSIYRISLKKSGHRFYTASDIIMSKHTFPLIPNSKECFFGDPTEISHILLKRILCQFSSNDVRCDVSYCLKLRYSAINFSTKCRIFRQKSGTILF